MTRKKVYLGKGKKNGKFPIIRASICLDEIGEMFQEFEGKKYITFEVAELRNPDKFGNTHTVYFNVFYPEKKEAVTK